MVAKLHNKGPEFYRKTTNSVITPKLEAELTTIEAENEVLAELHGEK